MEIDIPTESQLAAPTQPSGSNALRIPLRPPRAKQTTTCPECGEELLQKTLQRHIETVHTKQTPLRCAQCAKTFYRKDYLLRHCREKHDDAAETVECMYCGKQVRQRYLNEHWKGRKCMNAQVPKTEIAKGLSATSLMDPLVVATSLYILTTEASLHSKFSIEDNGFVYDVENVPRQHIDEIWSLRDLVLYQTRKNVSKACSTGTRITLDVVLHVQLLTLAFVDTALFGLGSNESSAHSNFLSSRSGQWLVAEGYHDQLYKYEAVIDHCWSRVPRHYIVSSDQDLISILAGRPLGFLYWLREPDCPEGGLDVVHIPRSLKYGQWLVNNPIIRDDGDIHFVFEP